MRRGHGDDGDARGRRTTARDGVGRRRRSAAAFLAALAMVILGCTQFDVRARQDPNADFARLQTYAWLPPDQAEPADQRVNDRFVDRLIRAATENGLRAKGYRPADSGPADLLLNYRLSTSSSDAPHGYGPGYARGLWGGWPDAAVVYDSHDIGTLYLAALNGATKQMIWVGAARSRILPDLSDDKRRKRVNTAVQQILASFPQR